MTLDLQFQKFSIKKTEGRRNFFHVNNAENWDFKTYSAETHEGLNKHKIYNIIKMNYIDDLNWIKNSDVPQAIKEEVKQW